MHTYAIEKIIIHIFTSKSRMLLDVSKNRDGMSFDQARQNLVYLFIHPTVHILLEGVNILSSSLRCILLDSHRENQALILFSL